MNTLTDTLNPLIINLLFVVQTGDLKQDWKVFL